MNVHRLQRRASVLQVLAVLAGVCLVGVGLVVLLVYRTITVGGDIRAVRGVLLKDLGVKCASKVEISAQPWVVALTRLGLGFAPLEPEARLAMKSIRSAEVGVYRLAANLNDRERCELFRQVATRMADRHWDRTVTVIGRDEMVMVFSPDEKENSSNIDAFVFVLNGRDLVLVSGRGNLDPIVELARTKMGESMPAQLAAHWRH